MDLGLKGKVAMVSGASRGLGFAVAEALAREGASVSMSSSTQASIEGAAERVSSSGAQVMASDPLFVGQEGLGELYWWDALNAVASISGGVVSYKSRSIDVVQNGPSTGRSCAPPWHSPRADRR